MRALSVQQITTRLDDRFRLLTGWNRTALRRQQTLRALIDWTHDLLSKGERILFRRLAVFAGDWSLEAADVVCSGDGIEEANVLDLLTGLVDKSLVVFDGQSEAMRYRFLETVRAYAGEKLFDSVESQVLRDRHRDWCVALAEQAEVNLWGPSCRAWLDRLKTDYANLRAALEWCLATDIESGLRLAGSLWGFWFQSDTREGYRWLAATLRSAPRSSLGRPKVLLGASFCGHGSRHREQARMWTEECLAIARATGD